MHIDGMCAFISISATWKCKLKILFISFLFKPLLCRLKCKRGFDFQNAMLNSFEQSIKILPFRAVKNEGIKM